MPKKENKKQKWEDQLDFIKALNTAYGGNDMTKADS